MNVLVVGAGPAGLTFAYFLKKNNRNHTVQVLERRRANESAGWGITMPARSLERFGYNLNLHKTIDSSCISWAGEEYLSTPVEVITISRDALIEFLSSRCVSVGVDLQFNSLVEASDIEIGRFDLIVGADGINSVIRRRFAEHVFPSATSSDLHHTWLATPKLFGPKLWNILRVHNGALLSAWGYQYNESFSCFIVECTSAGLQKSGFTNVSGEEGCRRIARAFSVDLDGQPVMAGKHLKWTRFELLKNRHWHYQNVVLIGDSAHTTHFSKGYGTELGMADAVRLTEHIAASPDVSAALASFEHERMPEVSLSQMRSVSSHNWYQSVLKNYESGSVSSVAEAIRQVEAVLNQNKSGAFA